MIPQINYLSEVKPAKIIEITCEVFGKSTEDFYSRSRKDKIPMVRQAATRLIRERNTLMTLKQIADIFSPGMSYDHTTIIHNMERSRADYDTNDEYRAKYDECVRRISIEENKVKLPFTSMAYAPQYARP